MEWRWIVYGALFIWLSGALFDLLVGSMRVFYATTELGRPLRATWSYFVNGVYTLLAFGTLAWLFYSDYIGEFWTIMIGCMVSVPEALYLVWSIHSASLSDGT